MLENKQQSIFFQNSVDLDRELSDSSPFPRADVKWVLAAGLETLEVLKSDWKASLCFQL